MRWRSNVLEVVAMALVVVASVMFGFALAWRAPDHCTSTVSKSSDRITMRMGE